MKKSFYLTDIQKKKLLEHSKKNQPNEACALLFGTEDEKGWKVKEQLFTKNIENSPVNFTISNEELIEAYKMAEEKKLNFVGIFHSHPESPAFPSQTDQKFMKINPVVWLIWSDTLQELNAFYFEEKIVEIPLEVLSD